MISERLASLDYDSSRSKGEMVLERLRKMTDLLVAQEL